MKLVSRWNITIGGIEYGVRILRTVVENYNKIRLGKKPKVSDDDVSLYASVLIGLKSLKKFHLKDRFPNLVLELEDIVIALGLYVAENKA